jgi:hypothetical protein
MALTAGYNGRNSMIEQAKNTHLLSDEEENVDDKRRNTAKPESCPKTSSPELRSATQVLFNTSFHTAPSEPPSSYTANHLNPQTKRAGPGINK